MHTDRKDNDRRIDFDNDLFRIRRGVVFLNLAAATDPERATFWHSVIEARAEEIAEAFPASPSEPAFLGEAVMASLNEVGGLPVFGMFVDKTAATSKGWVDRVCYPDA